MQPLRVLLIEDSEDDAKLLRNALRRGGYAPAIERVETAAAMREALARDTWDIVIADYVLPQFSGMTALAILHETPLDLPFIMVSGKLGEETAVEVMRAGAGDYILKDNLARLIPAIERELREAKSRREHKQAEEALQRLQEQERVYLYTVAHDLRAPLTIISGQLNLLLDLLPTGDIFAPYQRNISSIRLALKRMNRMIDNLTEITRLESQPLAFTMEAIDLKTLLHGVLRDNREGWDIARIRLEIADDLPPVKAAPDRLGHIFCNLLSNAFKYSPSGTPICLRARQQGDEVVVSVSDRGQGIPAADLPHIFDRFYRATQGRHAEGIGLGLYITKLLVEAHGGRIWVDSAWGQGSTFSFTLMPA